MKNAKRLVAEKELRVLQEHLALKEKRKEKHDKRFSRGKA